MICKVHLGKEASGTGMCATVCVSGTTKYLRGLILLKRKMTGLKPIQGVTETIETEDSAKPNKIHGFRLGGRRQEQRSKGYGVMLTDVAPQHHGIFLDLSVWTQYEYPWMLPQLAHIHHRGFPLPAPEGCEFTS
ncbi:hypothetical protein WISP_100013 [Willisornis vidua]|uniref:Uncharacterized protein n=1 Tax=Willisornis vidua TaxID=1566151 RepID=A0ABQ9CYV8_9PASS|nr:hypothetical protein WISP_100013 [Willisornis vidua]